MRSSSTAAAAAAADEAEAATAILHVSSVARVTFILGAKKDPKSHFLRLYGCTSVFNTALRTAPCLERVAGPLEVVVRPRAAQKIRQNPCLATLHVSL